MWFKNTRTGLIWLVLDEKQIEELKKSAHFVEVEKPTSQPKDETPKPSNHECVKCKKTFKSEKALNGHNRMVHKEGDK